MKTAQIISNFYLCIRNLINLQSIPNPYFHFTIIILLCRLFDHDYQSNTVNPKIPAESKHYVDGCAGIKVNCGSTPCVFEMIAYQFQEEVVEMPQVNIQANFVLPSSILNPGMYLCKGCVYSIHIVLVMS